MPIKNKIRKVLFGGLILFMLGGGLGAEEIKPKPVIEQTLEQKASNPKVKITFNSKIETEAKKPDYSVSETDFYRKFLLIDDYLLRSSNIPKLSSAEEIQVRKIIKDIRYGNINSYDNFVENSKIFSESQKIVLLSAIGDLLNDFTYNKSNHEIYSQDAFFHNLQESLESGNQNGLGDCAHIHTHLEQLANDLGIKAAAVTGIDGSVGEHVYTILKTEEGSAIIDYGGILIADTKNIEKILETYQKNVGSTAFQHLFFEDTEFKDTEFKYRLITKDGRRFLDFIEYDESSEPLKNILLNDFEPETDLTIAFNFEDYLTSIEYNHMGIFAKAGEIRGDDSSPLNKINLFQLGFQRDFSFPSFININPDIGLVYGTISQDKEIENDKIFGVKGSLTTGTNNKKGLNLGARIAGNIFGRDFLLDYSFFYNLLVAGGVSCNIPIKDLIITPYITTQFFGFTEDIGTAEFRLGLEEVGFGTVFDIKTSKNTNFSIEPYYLKRIWEQEFGGKAKFEIDDFGINAQGYVTKSDYEFCPNKYGFNIGADLNSKNLRFGINYGLEGTDYDGEVENKSSLKIQANAKF